MWKLPYVLLYFLSFRTPDLIPSRDIHVHLYYNRIYIHVAKQYTIYKMQIIYGLLYKFLYIIYVTIQRLLYRLNQVSRYWNHNCGFFSQSSKTWYNWKRNQVWKAFLLLFLVISHINYRHIAYTNVHRGTKSTSK